MNMEGIARMGDELHEARVLRRAVAPLTDRYPDITVDDAYHISQRLLELRCDDGERVVGKKIGITSAAVQRMLGVDQPDFGFLTDAMWVRGGVVKVADFIAPRAEAEIAFILKQDLRGPRVTPAAVLEATSHVMTCFEIVDSRIRDWKIRLQDTIADNASCGAFVLGQSKDPRGLDLASLKVTFEKNGRIIGTGLGAAVQGAPQNAVAWLANALSFYDVPLRAGEIILSGSLVPLEDVRAGDRMRAVIDDFGDCIVEFQ
jgi:2-oxopent-4-enoate/cis-2-oxohex-4-enoate hydratase